VDGEYFFSGDSFWEIMSLTHWNDQETRTTHFHIYARLPGLNGSAHNGRGDNELING